MWYTAHLSPGLLQKMPKYTSFITVNLSPYEGQCRATYIFCTDSKEEGYIFNIGEGSLIFCRLVKSKVQIRNYIYRYIVGYTDNVPLKFHDIRVLFVDASRTVNLISLKFQITKWTNNMYQISSFFVGMKCVPYRSYHIVKITRYNSIFYKYMLIFLFLKK